MSDHNPALLLEDNHLHLLNDHRVIRMFRARRAELQHRVKILLM